jgi:hypothetical protein
MEVEGNFSLAREQGPPTRKTRASLQQTLRESMQRTHSSSTKRIFIHDGAIWIRLIYPLYYRTCFTDSGYPLVVMVEPTHYRNGDQLVSCMMRGNSRSARFRNLLPNPLMGSRPVEVGHILIEHAACAVSREESTGGEAHACHTLLKKRSQIALARGA